MTYLGSRVPRWIVRLGVAIGLLLAMLLIGMPIAQLANDVREKDLTWPYAFILMWRDLQAWLARFDWMVLFGAILIFGTIVIFTKMSRSQTGAFDFADAFAGENNKTSMAKLTAWIGSLTASWLMVALTVSGKMTELYMGTYLGILVLGKVGTEAVGVLRQSQIARTAEALNAPPDDASTTGSVRADVNVSADLPAALTTDLKGVKRPLGKPRS